MPFETLFPTNVFTGAIKATVHEHGGTAPSSIVRTDQSWAVNIDWEVTGPATGMITGNWDLHLLLERMGPGSDLDLTDSNDHFIPLRPGVSPVNYSRHFDVPAGRVPPGIYKLVVMLRYIEPTGSPGPMSAYEEITPLVEFYNP